MKKRAKLQLFFDIHKSVCHFYSIFYHIWGMDTTFSSEGGPWMVPIITY